MILTRAHASYARANASAAASSAMSRSASVRMREPRTVGYSLLYQVSKSVCPFPPSRDRPPIASVQVAMHLFSWADLGESLQSVSRSILAWAAGEVASSNEYATRLTGG